MNKCSLNKKQLNKRFFSCGQSTVEMAIVFPILLMCFCAVAEWGYLFYRGMDLTAAVREGSRYAAKEKPTKAQIIQRVQDSAMFNVDKIWILPAQVDSTTNAPQALRVVGQILLGAITPFDEVMKMIAKSSDTFRVHFLSASATFKFQVGYDPSIFDDIDDFDEFVEESNSDEVIAGLAE